MVPADAFLKLILTATGAAVGSYVSCLIDRSSAAASSTGLRSRCDACDGPLSPWDLIPIVSYLALAGRCRSCKAGIPIRFLAGEMSFALATAAVVLFLPSELVIFNVALAWTLLALSQFDLMLGRLPNGLNVTLLVLGLTSVVLNSQTLLNSVSGALFGGSISLLVANLYRIARRRDGLGGGDIKLFGASGALIGWQAIPWLLLISSVGALAIVSTGLVSREKPIPFGPFIAAATFSIWCLRYCGWWMP